MLLVGPSVYAADLEQSTSGWCSPAINGNGNQIICRGIDPRAMARLEELLDQKDHDLNAKIAEANEWVRKYRDLDAQLAEARRQLEIKGEDATLLQAAQDLRASWPKPVSFMTGSSPSMRET